MGSRPLRGADPRCAPRRRRVTGAPTPLSVLEGWGWFGALGVIIGGLSHSVARGMVTLTIAVPLLFLLVVIYVGVLLELITVIVQMAEIAARGRRGPPSRINREGRCQVNVCTPEVIW